MKVTLTELPTFAHSFLESLPKELGVGAEVVGLRGDLGAGKTTFVQEVAKALGVSARVTSPTFVIAQAYPIHFGPFERLIHIDAYRLDATETDTVGWGAYTKDPRNLILVEWPERVPAGFPTHTRLLEFTVLGDTERNIEEKKS